MKSVIILLSLFSIMPGDDTCRMKFFRASLKDTVRSASPFVKVRFIDSVGVRKDVLLPNFTLYKIVSKKFHLDYTGYMKFMNAFYLNRNEFNYKEFKELDGGVFLDSDEYVENIAGQGKNALIKHFFIDGVFDFKYIKYFEAVVGKLFDYNVLVGFVENGNTAIVYDGKCTL